MPNGDAGISKDTGLPSSERNPDKEFEKASEMGRLVLQVAKERENPRFGVRRYAMPMLDPNRFPSELAKAVAQKEQITESDIDLANRASLSLVVEAAAQIVEARSNSNEVSEDINSIKQMLRMINRGRGLVMQTERQDPQAIIEAGKGAIKRRTVTKVREKEKVWDDQKVRSWTEETLQKAAGRLGRIISAIDAVHRSF